MLSSHALKQIVAEARPIIERQLDDADQIAALREVVTAQGGDWSALKALIKAQVQDERDEAGDGKRVRKILDKADYATTYAGLLGLANMNEQNFPAAETTIHNSSVPAGFDPETGEDVTTSAGAQIIEGMAEALAVSRGEAEPHQVHEPQPETAKQSQGDATMALGVSFAGTEGDEGQHPIQPETAVQSAEPEKASAEDGRDVEAAGGAAPVLTNSYPASTSPQISLAGEGSSNPQPTPAAPLNNSAPRSSSGLERMPGCKNLDACAGSRTKRCFTCEREWNSKNEVSA